MRREAHQATTPLDTDVALSIDKHQVFQPRLISLEHEQKYKHAVRTLSAKKFGARSFRKNPSRLRKDRSRYVFRSPLLKD